MISEEKRLQGIANRKKGKAFELEIRKILEDSGWLVIRFDQNPDVVVNQLKKAKPLFIPGRGFLMNSPGFPDFFCYNLTTKEAKFVECKLHGYLKPEEKKKAAWLNLHIKIPIYVATKKDGEYEYKLQTQTESDL